jgi:hypothetical protein
VSFTFFIGFFTPGPEVGLLTSPGPPFDPRLFPFSLPPLAEFCLVFGTRGPDGVRVIVGGILGDFTTTGPGVIGLVGDFRMGDCSARSGSNESTVALRFGSAFGRLLANDVSIVAVRPDPPDVPLGGGLKKIPFAVPSMFWTTIPPPPVSLLSTVA